MTTSSMVHIRIDNSIKAQATEALTAIGLSISDAVRVFLVRIAAEKQIPFALKVPNLETAAAMRRTRTGMTTPYQDADALFAELDAAVSRTKPRKSK